MTSKTLGKVDIVDTVDTVDTVDAKKCKSLKKTNSKLTLCRLLEIEKIEDLENLLDLLLKIDYNDVVQKNKIQIILGGFISYDVRNGKTKDKNLYVKMNPEHINFSVIYEKPVETGKPIENVDILTDLTFDISKKDSVLTINIVKNENENIASIAIEKTEQKISMKHIKNAGEKNDTHHLSTHESRKAIFSMVFKKLIDYLNVNIEKIKDIALKPQSGGYHNGVNNYKNKYLKYKNKYITLKKKIDAML